MKKYSLVSQLIAVIELILQYHECGLRVLTGGVEPTAQEISDIIRAISTLDEIPQRIAAAFPSSPQERSLLQAETILAIVNQAGGWPGISVMAREFRSMYSKTWEIFRSHVEWIEGAGMRLETETTLERIAGKFGTSTDSVRRTRRFVVYKIASAALRTDRVLTNE